MIIRINFDTQFIPMEDETRIIPSWEWEPGEERDTTRRWPIELLFIVTHHRVVKPRNDSFGCPMAKGDHYFRISPCVCNRGFGHYWEAKDKGQSEEKAFAQYQTTMDYRWEESFFLWNVHARLEWQTSRQFDHFYLGSRLWTRAKTCADCSKTARKIGLYDRRGQFRWYIAWDKPGQYRCDKCHLIYAIFGTKSAEQPPN